MGRRYRRGNSRSSIVSDSVFIGSRLPWWGAILFGAVTFVLFYYIAPVWLESKLLAQETSRFYPILEAVFGRRIHWLKWLGVACGLIGLFYGIRNYLVSSRAGNSERSIVSLLSRLFGKGLE